MRDVFDTFLRIACNCKGQGKTFANDRFARHFSTKCILEPIMMWKGGLLFQKKNHIFKHRHSVKPGVMQQAKPVPFRKCNRIIPDSKQSMSRKGIVGKIFPKQYGHGRDITNP